MRDTVVWTWTKLEIFIPVATVLYLSYFLLLIFWNILTYTFSQSDWDLTIMQLDQVDVTFPKISSVEALKVNIHFFINWYQYNALDFHIFVMHYSSQLDTYIKILWFESILNRLQEKKVAWSGIAQLITLDVRHCYI